MAVNAFAASAALSAAETAGAWQALGRAWKGRMSHGHNPFQGLDKGFTGPHDRISTCMDFLLHDATHLSDLGEAVALRNR